MEQREAAIALIFLVIGGVVGGIAVTSLIDKPERSESAIPENDSGGTAIPGNNGSETAVPENVGIEATNAENVRQVVVGEQNASPVREVTHRINATIPADNTEGTDTINVSLEFTRNISANPVFNYNANDPVLLRGDFRDTPEVYLLLVDLAGPTIFSSVTSTNASIPLSGTDWKPRVRASGAARVSRTPSSSIDTVVRFDTRRYFAYSDRTVYRLFNDQENTIPFSVEDPGVYYDGQKYHLYYESGNTTGHSGTEIGHATSPNGFNDWTKKRPVYTMEGEYQSGDYDIIEKDGVYFLFGDYTTDHPEYNVSVWVNDDLDSEFTRVGEILSSTESEQGIQDVTVKYDETEKKFAIYAYVHKSDGDELHYATGEIIVKKDN